MAEHMSGKQIGFVENHKNLLLFSLFFCTFVCIGTEIVMRDFHNIKGVGFYDIKSDFAKHN